MNKVVWIVPLGLFALGLSSAVAFASYQHHKRRSDPASAFQDIVGQPLPVSIRATEYNSQLTDNLFHSSHYWVLVGSEAEIRQFALTQGFAESREDAKDVVPELERVFGVTASGFLTGYEKGNGRNHWLVLFNETPAAIYVH